jgi:transcriptional regulator with XRE-family HTH domain
MNISSARKFAMDADVDQSQYSKIERGELPLTDAIFDKLNKKYKIDKEHVLGIIVPHETNSKQKHITTRNNLKEVGESKRGIMVYESAPVQAGIRTVYHDEHAVPDYVLNIPQFRDCNYGTRASGDSMYPEVRNGDLIVCKELAIDARIIYGDMYVIHTKDGIETIKYVQQFVDSDKNDPWVLLVPHNKAAGMGTPIPRNEIIKLFKVRAIFKAY